MWSEHAYRILPATLNVFIVLYLLLTLSHVFIVDPAIRTQLVTAATFTAVFAAGFRFFVRSPLVKQFAERILITLVVLGAANSLLHLLLTGDIKQSTNLIFVIAACGFLVTDTRFFIAISLVTMVIWIVIIIMLANVASVHFAYALIMGGFLATLLHLVRRQSIRQHDALEIAARSLATSEHRAEIVLRSVADGVLSTNARGYITLCNQVAANLLGRSVAQVIGMPVDDLLDLNLEENQPGRTRGKLNASDGQQLDIEYEVSDLEPDIEAPSGGRVILFQELTVAPERQSHCCLRWLK